MMRSIIEVISQIKSILIKHNYVNENGLVQELDDIIDSSHYIAPECISSLWIRLKDALYDEFGEPHTPLMWEIVKVIKNE